MKRLALVEDNPDNRLLVNAMLEDKFFIDEYENGKDALEGIIQNIPDLILLDISLPEMDGKEVLKQLRQNQMLHHIPAIALTAHAMKGDKEQCLAAGFNDYITKPILDENILIDAINHLVE